MLTRLVCMSALAVSLSCTPASTGHQISFRSAATEQAPKHHTKISPLGATGIAVLGAAVAGFAGIMIFVFPRSAG